MRSAAPVIYVSVELEWRRSARARGFQPGRSFRNETRAIRSQKMTETERELLRATWRARQNPYLASASGLNDVIQRKLEASPEGTSGTLFVLPLDVGGGQENGQHGARHSPRLRVFQLDQHHDVIALHDADLAELELELAPLTVSEVRREDHEHAIAFADAVGDVVHDVLARHEVSLVNADPQPPLLLQDGEQLLLHPPHVLLGVGQEDVIFVAMQLPFCLTSLSLVAAPAHLVEPETQGPAIAVDNGDEEEEGDDDADDDDDVVGRETGEETNLDTWTDLSQPWTGIGQTGKGFQRTALNVRIV